MLLTLSKFGTAPAIGQEKQKAPVKGTGAGLTLLKRNTARTAFADVTPRMKA